ncbi:hypothetical protein ASPTUDRAFT_55191 [Aspergillus tubingensis CBS 134.48]|uniref:Protein kinase domain-containing protein n=1 Tax=Aspergillus tubingensis (strain CBS 134.48) TaxID=767770 RepID=A0A1L9N8S2_ASPTC|nr:hypothetical protein ASPTUDRAFT_55191 [Aspergillus tubingensis CBS 134.48]
MELDLPDIDFVEQIKSSTSSCIFRTRWRNRDCILKVRWESQAYIRLKAHGLFHKGSIPDFYSLVTGINPNKWLPYLNEFFDENLLPNAILIEYIPNLQQIGLYTFCKERVNKLHQILADIHQAGVYHADPYARNMMVQEGSDRVLWLDFNRAQTFSYDSITARQRQWLEEKDELMDYFVDVLAADYEEGKIHRTWECYYEKFKSLLD